MVPEEAEDTVALIWARGVVKMICKREQAEGECCCCFFGGCGCERNARRCHFAKNGLEPIRCDIRRLCPPKHVKVVNFPPSATTIATLARPSNTLREGKGRVELINQQLEPLGARSATLCCIAPRVGQIDHNKENGHESSVGCGLTHSLASIYKLGSPKIDAAGNDFAGLRSSAYHRPFQVTTSVQTLRADKEIQQKYNNSLYKFHHRTSWGLESER